MNAKVTTDNKPRTTMSLADLPESARENFNYLDESEHYDYRFVKYRGEWFDVTEFEAITVAPNHRPFGHNVSQDSPLAEWDAIFTTSCFDGIVFRWADNFESLIVGHYSA